MSYSNYAQYVSILTYKEMKQRKDNWIKLFSGLFLGLLLFNIFIYMYILSCFNIDSTGVYFTMNDKTYIIEEL